MSLEEDSAKTTTTTQIKIISKIQKPETPMLSKAKANCVIVTANGVKIQSTLNPNAKEFYPSYVKKEGLEHLKVTTENEATVATKSNCEEILGPVLCQASAEDIIQEVHDENCSKAVTVERPKGVMKIIEIMERAIEKKNTPTVDCREEKVVRPITKDPKELFFGSNIVKNNDPKVRDGVYDKMELLGVNSTLTKYSQHVQNKMKICTDIGKELDSIVPESNKNAKDVEDHKYESDIDLEMQINQLSKSQTNIKPTITKEILDGLAPPTSPRTDLSVKHIVMSLDKPKNLKKPTEELKILKKTTTPKTMASIVSSKIGNIANTLAKGGLNKVNISKESIMNESSKLRKVTAPIKMKTPTEFKSYTVGACNKSSTKPLNTTATFKSIIESQKKEAALNKTTPPKESTNTQKEKCNFLHSRTSPLNRSTCSKFSNTSAIPRATPSATSNTVKPKETYSKVIRNALAMGAKKTDSQKGN